MTLIHDMLIQNIISPHSAYSCERVMVNKSHYPVSPGRARIHSSLVPLKASSCHHIRTFFLSTATTGLLIKDLHLDFYKAELWQYLLLVSFNSIEINTLPRTGTMYCTHACHYLKIIQHSFFGLNIKEGNKRRGFFNIVFNQLSNAGLYSKRYF